MYKFFRKVAMLLLPPLVVSFIRRLRYLFVKPSLEYAPCGWETKIDNDAWNSEIIVNDEKDKWAAFALNLRGAGPLGFSHEHYDLTEIRNVYFHNIHITYAYVLALAARQNNTICIFR
ncbi:MAG: hypothetical protein Q7J06_10025 [Bacteroidales bacterium]|nr:hypothetical protein [Bacteroidales bacterium]